MPKRKPRKPRKIRAPDYWDEFPVVHRPGHPLADKLNMVPRRLVAERGNDAPQVISDDLGRMLEHHGYADGRQTDSKSVFRQWTAQAGLVEKGNDRKKPKAPDSYAEKKKLSEAVGKAIRQVNEGYRPALRFDPTATGSGWH